MGRGDGRDPLPRSTRCHFDKGEKAFRS